MDDPSFGASHRQRAAFPGAAPLRAPAQALEAAGAVNGKKLGHCLERLERRDVNGAQIFRLGKNNKGIIWRVCG
jgi:hypothetical protein